jgi:type I restriction enzyme S subunit
MMTSNDWKKSTIAELCDIVKGSAPIQKTVPGPYSLVTTGEDRRTADGYQLDCEAVCVPMISSTGHGHASLKRVHYQSGKFALANILTALLVRDKSQLAPRFLALYLNYFKDQLLVPLMVGAANMSLTVDRLASVTVSFPSLDYQNRTVSILDDVEELRMLRAQADRRTADLIPALFYEMFGDPATNPKAWPIVQMHDIIEGTPNYGTMIPPRPEVGGWLDIRVANIREGELDLSDRKYVDLPADAVVRHEVRPGDLLLARAIGSYEQLGKCIVADPGGERWAFDSHLMRVRFRPSMAIPEVIRAFLVSPGGRRLFLNRTRESAVQFNINVGEFSAIPVPLAPLPLQRKFATRVSEIRALQTRQAESRRRLDNLLQSMLHRVFQGEL